MSVKNLSKLFRSASRIVNKKVTPTSAPAGSSAEDLALKQYISAIDASTSKSKTVFKQFLNYKSPNSDSSSSSNKALGDFPGIGNLTLLSAADNAEESAKLLSAEISAILRGDPNLDLGDSPESPSGSDGSFGNILVSPWNPSTSHNNIALRRKEISRERKQKWIFKTSQTVRFDRLVMMCGQKLGPDTTIQVLSKLGRATGVKEFNALILLCIDAARKTDDEEVSLNQIFVAYKIFELMKERGFEIEEMSYGPFLRYLIDCSLVPEFHFFCDLIRDEKSHPRLAYYEMLLYIGVKDDEKIQELCYDLALYDGEDKSSFQESYLLAFCDGDQKKELLQLLETFDITKVSSMRQVAKIFKSLGKLSMESVVERFLLSLNVNDIGVVNISSFICDYAVSNPNLAVEDVIVKFKNLHATLDLVPTCKQYQKLIRYCCELLKVHKALDIVDEMFKVGFTLSLGTCHLLLDACEDSKEYNLVRCIYSMISLHDLKPNTDTFRKMINLSVKMKDYKGAYGMIEDLGRLHLMPTANIYNTIMAGFFREKNIPGALTVLKQMQDADVKPDSQTYSYLLSNCNCEEDIGKIYEELEQSGVHFTKHIYMALINAYAACGQFEKAKEVVLDKGVPLKSLNEIRSALVSALASNGQMSDALDVFSEIKKADCNLEPKAAICLIEHLQSEGELTRLLQILEEIENSDFWMEGCFRIILYCVRHLRLNTAVDLLKRIRDKGDMDEEDAGNIFNELFCQFAENEPSDMQFGMDLLQAVKKELNTQPSRKSLDFLLTASISAKDLNACFVIWKEYKAAGLPYNVLSYMRMYQALLALGDHKSAAAILNKIPKDDPHVNLVVQGCQATFMRTRAVSSKTPEGKKLKKTVIKS